MRALRRARKDTAMRWVITLSAAKVDAERLVAAAIEDLAPHPTDLGTMLLELEDAFGDESTDETRHAVREDIDLRLRHINGFGKLRWGRGFGGVEVKAVRSFDSTGAETQHVFVGTAYAHQQPREFADMIEKWGHPRPPLPAGLDVIEALDAGAVAKLAKAQPVVDRVLHLVELMLEGDQEIDWAAAYSALETIEHDLLDRGVDGHALGWWTRRERGDFKATATARRRLVWRRGTEGRAACQSHGCRTRTRAGTSDASRPTGLPTYSKKTGAAVRARDANLPRSLGQERLSARLLR